MALHHARKTMYAAIIPNRAHLSEPLAFFATTVEQVQRRTGLEFFAALEDLEERQLESTLNQFK